MILKVIVILVIASIVWSAVQAFRKAPEIEDPNMEL